jgi:hypothetical protein
LVTHVLHTEIDKQKWDECILNSPNSMVYACSWYLDCMAPYWEALIMGDYDYIMPLPVRSKLGIKYIFQPLFTAQLGVFGYEKITADIVNAFMQQFNAITKFAEYDLNYACYTPQYPLLQRNNYILPFKQQGYTQIAAHYNRLANRKLLLAQKNELILQEGVDYHTIIDLCKQDTINKNMGFALHEFEDAKKLFTYATQHGLCITVGAYKNNVLLSSIAAIIYNNRIFSLVAGNTAEAKTHGAFYAVLDYLLQKYANTNYVFDFEGSDVEGIAFVFKNLGGIAEPYYYYKYNNLPFPLNKIKK